MKANEETLKKMQEKTESIRKQIEDYKSGDKMNYWACPTSWMEEAAKYGAENIFLISSSYSSHAYDDYASFTYFNQATKEEFKDNWTTAAACPSYGSYECMTVTEAFKKGLLDEEKYVDYLKHRRLKFLGETFRIPTLRVGDFIEYKIRVEVKGGRKWKGTGYALSYKTVYFGYHATNYVSILDPETNVIHEISSQWVHPAEDISEMTEQYKEWARKRIESMTSDSLHIGSNGLTVDVDTRFEEWLKERADAIEINLNGAVNPAQQERDKRKEEFKTRKMADLVEWVKKNTDKEGDAILQLAEHIFQKRYA